MRELRVGLASRDINHRVSGLFFHHKNCVLSSPLNSISFSFTFTAAAAFQTHNLLAIFNHLIISRTTHWYTHMRVGSDAKKRVEFSFAINIRHEQLTKLVVQLMLAQQWSPRHFLSLSTLSHFLDARSRQWVSLSWKRRKTFPQRNESFSFAIYNWISFIQMQDSVLTHSCLFWREISQFTTTLWWWGLDKAAEERLSHACVDGSSSFTWTRKFPIPSLLVPPSLVLTYLFHLLCSLLFAIVTRAALFLLSYVRINHVWDGEQR